MRTIIVDFKTVIDYHNKNSMMTYKLRITHMFRLAAPYDEDAPGSKNNFTLVPRRHIVEDRIKNNFLIDLFRSVRKLSV